MSQLVGPVLIGEREAMEKSENEDEARSAPKFNHHIAKPKSNTMDRDTSVHPHKYSNGVGVTEYGAGVNAEDDQDSGYGASANDTLNSSKLLLGSNNNRGDKIDINCSSNLCLTSKDLSAESNTSVQQTSNDTGERQSSKIRTGARSRSRSNHNHEERYLNRPGDTEELVDITDQFMEAVQCLELGELYHDPCFGLFEAMSAIEMMDPKMDAGMICNKGKRAVLNLEQAIESGELKLDGFSPEELIGIMDTTICCFITWLEGHSLAQTVFTNLYLQNPTVIVDKHMRAFSIAILKLVDVTEECISKASVFEEEDFQPALYGYNLATQINDSKATSSLRECEEDIQKKLKNSRSHQGSKSESSKVDHNFVDKWLAVQARQKFTRVLHQLLLYLWKKDNLSDCPKLLSLCFESLAILQKTFSLGISRATDETEPFMIGFDLLVNQRLLPPTFPRSTRIKHPEETFKYLEGFLYRVKAILKITTVQSFHGIVEFFNAFSETQPCVLSRSLLQLLYSPLRFKKPGVEEMIETMKESVKTFIAPPVLMSKTPQQLNSEVGECVEMFFDRCATPFATLLVVWGHNRARQRDKLAHVLDDFANLQLETERIDAYIHSLCLKMDGVRPHGNCFGNWLLYHISKIMIRYILTGFELELYSVHEFAYIYWYLYEFLYGWLVSAISRADNYLAEQDAAAANEKSKKGAKNKNKTNTKKKAFNKEIYVTQAEQYLAGGLFKAMMGFINDKKIPLPHAEFDNEMVRYRHRFMAFNAIRTPAPVHYLQYKSVADLSSGQPSRNLYDASARSFYQAKQYLEAISPPEKAVTDLLKVAKTNLIVVKLLASGHTKNSSVPPEFDFSSHIHFPIIKVK